MVCIYLFYSFWFWFSEFSADIQVKNISCLTTGGSCNRRCNVTIHGGTSVLTRLPPHSLLSPHTEKHLTPSSIMYFVIITEGKKALSLRRMPVILSQINPSWNTEACFLGCLWTAQGFYKWGEGCMQEWVRVSNTSHPPCIASPRLTSSFPAREGGAARSTADADHVTEVITGD